MFSTGPQSTTASFALAPDAGTVSYVAFPAVAGSISSAAVTESVAVQTWTAQVLVATPAGTVPDTAQPLGGDGLRAEPSPALQPQPPVAGTNPQPLATGLSHADATSTRPSATPAQDLSVANLARPSLVPSGGERTVTAPALLTPSVVSTPVDQAPDLQTTAFRISRTPADGGRLQVGYVQTAFGPAGATAQEGVATFAPGSARVDISVASAGEQRVKGRELITLTLRGDRNYRIARPTATLFLVDASRGCSDRVLLEAFRCGQSSEAFDALFQRYRATVSQTCYALLRNTADAEDVSQIVFLMLAKQPVRLGMTLSGWLRTVARHASIGLLRARSRRLKHEKKGAKAERVPSEDEATALRDELEAALTQMAPPLRDAVRLRYLEGWSQKEAAQRLRCPRGTLSQRSTRGIQLLRDFLGRSAD